MRRPGWSTVGQPIDGRTALSVNPIGGEAGPPEAGDDLILLSRVVLDTSRPLPTNPPMAAASAR